jgi:hypothetical protein
MCPYNTTKTNSAEAKLMRNEESPLVTDCPFSPLVKDWRSETRSKLFNKSHSGGKTLPLLDLGESFHCLPGLITSSLFREVKLSGENFPEAS